MRESMAACAVRRLCHPWGGLSRPELRAKLGDVTLDWSELRASGPIRSGAGVPVDGWRRYAGCRRRSDCRADGRRLAVCAAMLVV